MKPPVSVANKQLPRLTERAGQIQVFVPVAIHVAPGQTWPSETELARQEQLALEFVHRFFFMPNAVECL